MAKKRMISRSLGGSKKIRRLIEDYPKIAEFTSLLFCLGIPHHDDYGLISSHAHDWKYNIYPTSDKTIPDFQEAIKAMLVVELLEISSCGEICRFVNYEKHQTFKTDRTKQSDFKEPDGIQWKPLVSVSEVKVSEVKVSEVKKPKTGCDEKGKPEPFQEYFDIMWSHYPRHDEKKNALNAYQARIRKGIAPDKLLAATKNYATAVKGKEKTFIKMAKTFFGPNEVWKDWVATKHTDPGFSQDEKLPCYDSLTHDLETDNEAMRITHDRYSELWDALEAVKTFEEFETWKKDMREEGVNNATQR